MIPTTKTTKLMKTVADADKATIKAMIEADYARINAMLDAGFLGTSLKGGRS
jgi:hypothetical protein